MLYYISFQRASRMVLMLLALMLGFSAYCQTGQVELTLRLTDAQGKPLEGVFSVSVCDAEAAGKDSCNAGGLAESLLCSEVKGRVEQPGYYFGNDNARIRSEVDLLLLTQGYRRYDLRNVMNDEYPTIVHSVEETQSVSGYITTARNSHPKNVKLSVFYPKTLQYTTYNLGDSSRFVLKELDFADGDEIILEATKSSGSGSGIVLHIDTVRFPRLHAVKGHGMTPVQGMDEDANYSMPDTDDQDIYDVIDLPDVEVKGRKHYRNRRGEADRGIMEGDPMFERLPDVQSMLRWLGIQLRYIENGELYFGKMAVTLVGQEFILTPTYIDDMLTDQQDIWHIEPSNIAQVEYLTPHNPMNIIYSSDAVNSGCLLIYMKKGAGKTKAREKKPNMVSLKPLGYQRPAEFRAYADDSTETSRPDAAMQTATLYWNPKVRTDENGDAVIRFNSPGGERKYFISIEGTLDDGTHISRQIRKEVGR